MPIFIVRVQLTNGTLRNYTVLKTALLKVGFSKNITAKNGTSYILPNGNYLGESNKTLMEILEIVKTVLSKIGDKKAMVLVTLSPQGGTAWVNLTPA
jgi:hypothetical protein